MKIKTAILVLLAVAVLGSYAGIYYVYKSVGGTNPISDRVSNTSLENVNTSAEIGEGSKDSKENFPCTNDCQEEIARQVAQAVATLSGSTKETIIEKQTVVSDSSSGTSYIPMGTSALTTNTDWTTIEDTAVYIDVENDYSRDAMVSWEASLKVAHGNGEAFARLYDDTNKIAVDFSELSTKDNADFKSVSSGNLPFWKGRNLYKVQLKSLNGFEVTYSGGKIKISY